MGRTEHKHQQKQSNRNKNWSDIQKPIKILLLVMLLVVLGGLVMVNHLISASDVSKLEELEPRPTFIYDQNGEIVSKISNSNIEGVHLDQIPKELIEAVISVEDQQFNKHHGINYLGIARAFTQNTLKGEVVAGGSTITQQLTKNAFLTQDRTYSRKFKELLIAKL